MIVYPKSLIAPRLYRIADTDGRHAQLNPISLGATPEQSPVDDLRRYRIRTTDEVHMQDREVQVAGILNPHADDLYEYEVEANGRAATVSEHELTVGEGSFAPDPADMLSQLDVAPWHLVSARTNLLESFFRATTRSLGIVGYNGARMLPIPHQINAARYAIQFGRIRFLLADEVGLGKTIEAGLIISTLRKYFPKWKTAVFVPESLTAQWAFELYGKFSKTIFALSEEEYDEEESGVVLPHDSAVSFAEDHQPDILVIDEAHRLIHDPKAIEALRRISRGAHAVLLLTATPVSDDWQNLLTLYRILDPERFDSITTPAELRALQQKQAKIEEILKAIRHSDPNPTPVQKLWAESGFKDAEVEQHLREAHHDVHGRHELHRMASLIVDRYYPGARMLRYRRKFLALDNTLPFRIVGTLEYKAGAEEAAIFALTGQWLEALKAAGQSKNTEAHRVASTLIQAAHSSPLAVTDWLLARAGKLPPPEGVTADPTRLYRRAMKALPALPDEKTILASFEDAVQKWQRAAKALDATGRQLARSPRYTTFLQFVKEILEEDPDAHILVFTSFEANVHPLFLLLRKALTDIAEVFEMYGQQSRTEREKNAFEFQEFPSGSVLVSDELGGEGRNFQFASHVVHYDLPLAPWIVEQRIGRCDRVGRDEEMDVDSQVLVAKGQLDEAFFEFLSDGVGVFNESIAPVEGELDRIMDRIMASCIDEGASGVLDQIDDVKEYLEEARERENAELLIRSAVGVEEARRIAQELKDDEELNNLKKATIAYARLFDSMVDEQENGRLAITVGEYHSLHGLPGVAAEMIGYFDRKEAVRHERLDFFSPGHPFVRSLALMAMTESPDRAAIVRRKGIDEPAIRFSYRISLPQEFIEAVRELPVDLRPPLLSKSAEIFCTTMVQLVLTLEGEVVPRDEANRLYYAPAQPDDKSLDHGVGIDDILPDDWGTKCLEIANAAEEHVRELNGLRLEDRVEEFEDLLCEVLTRVHPEHNLLESEVERLLHLASEMSIDLDSAVLLLPA